VDDSVPLFNIVILAAVQGITEFLPISSSAHLILVPILMGWQDQGLTIDVAVHVGTLLAVIIYFWSDIWAMLTGILRAIRPQPGRRRSGGVEVKLAMMLVVATIPAVLAGWFINSYASDLLRGIEIIAWATIGFAILLYVADKMSMTVRRIDHMGYVSAIFIGVMQVLALIPGTSRAGITMTAARLLGIERSDAAKFSMLLSIPVIIGAGALKGWELYQSGNVQLTEAAFVAALLSFIFALIAIALLMAWLKRASFTPFVIYRLILGGVLLYIVYRAPGFTF